MTTRGVTVGLIAADSMFQAIADRDLDRFSHRHMAIMRGFENEFSMARVAKQGYLTVSAVQYVGRDPARRASRDDVLSPIRRLVREADARCFYRRSWPGLPYPTRHIVSFTC
jgi:hypothetical protein